MTHIYCMWYSPHGGKHPEAAGNDKKHNLDTPLSIILRWLGALSFRVGELAMI